MSAPFHTACHPQTPALRFASFGQPAQPPAASSTAASPQSPRSLRPLSRVLMLGLAPYLCTLIAGFAVGL